MAKFDEQTYLKNKAAQLNAKGYQGKTWDASSVQKAFKDSGLSAQQHYQQYGKGEGVTPYNAGSAPQKINTAGKLKTSQFDTNTYLNNKALELNQRGYGGRNDWTAEQARLHMRDSGMTPEQHYLQYGRSEGVDPYLYESGITSAPSYAATTRSINPATDTVQGQITGLLDKNNPYMKRARARGQSFANSRGLLNSTMAGQAGEAAAIDAALPIASQDADSYLRQGMTNQQYQNQASRDNANFELSTGQFNAEYGQRMDLATMDDLRAREMQQADIDSREQIAQWDREVRENIAAIEMDAQTRAQFLESTNELMQQYQIQFQEIATNKDLSSDARNAAWRSLREMYDEQIKLSGDMMGVPLTRGDQGPWSMGGSDGAAGGNTGGNTGGDTGEAGNAETGGQAAPWQPQGEGDSVEAIREYQRSDDPNRKFFPENNPAFKQVQRPKWMDSLAISGYVVSAEDAFMYVYGGDSATTKKDGTFPSAADIGQTPPPTDGSFNQWLKTPASKMWRYNNRDMTIANGGKTVSESDLSEVEKQVYKFPDGISRSEVWDAYYEKRWNEGSSEG